MAVRYNLNYYLDHEWSNNKVLDEPGDDPDSILEKIAVCVEASNDNIEEGGETPILYQSIIACVCICTVMHFSQFWCLNVS